MKSRKVKAAAKSKAFMTKKKLRGNIPLSTYASDSDADVDENSLIHGGQELSSDEEAFVDNSSEEEEVLPITDEEDYEDEEEEVGADGNDNDDDDDEEEDEEEEDDEEAGLPSREAWGRKKSTYYNTDFVDKDRGKTYREEDELEAKGEEEEAMFIERNFLQLAGGRSKIPELDKEDIAQEKLVKENVVPLDKEGKLKFLKKKCPEIIVLINEFKEKLSEIDERIRPMLELLKSNNLPESASLYVKYKYHVLLQYCSNINFYMYLKSMGCNTDNHPVLDRIKEFSLVLERLNDSGTIAEKQIDIILEKLQNNEMQSLSFKSVNNVQQNRAKKIKASNGEDEDVEDEQMDVEADAADEKRVITYEIAKNKGLTAKRKKEYRNPRVHNRMKFKRAKVRRKGQVRGVIREVKKYDGEPTGISTHVVRSTKIK